MTIYDKVNGLLSAQTSQELFGFKAPLSAGTSKTTNAYTEKTSELHIFA